MSTSSAATVTVMDLPQQVLHHILGYLTPRDISSFAAASTDALNASQDSYVWSRVARRHFKMTHQSIQSAPRSQVEQADVCALIKKLSFHWEVAIGLLIADVPTHRRSGFLATSPRGGVEIQLSDRFSDAAYVFSGRFAHLAIPDAIPSLSLSFVLSEGGPFPVDGMQLRLIHAAEPSLTQRQPQSASTPSEVKPPGEFPSGSPTFSEACSQPQARIQVTLNGHLLYRETLNPSSVFTPSHLRVPSHLLVTAPSLNVLVVEYDRSSSAGYWLRDISLVPTIAAFPALPRTLTLPLPELASGTACSPSHNQTQDLDVQPPEKAPAVRESPIQSEVDEPRDSRVPPTQYARQGRRNAQANSPRRQQHDSVQAIAPLLLEGLVPTRARREQTPQHPAKSGRTPKHMYHRQNHARSPRACHTSVRPRARR